MGGWQSVTIGDVCQLINGGTPKTKVAEYWDGPHTWITPAEMGGRASPYITATRRTLSVDGLNKCSASLLPPRSVILSSRAPIGHLVINEVPMATNQGCKGLIPGDDLHYKFLYYYLYGIVDALNDLGSGTTFKELSATRLKAVPIPLPPLPEQERIVAILDEAFAAIATATANAEKNLANARELFESELNRIFQDPVSMDAGRNSGDAVMGEWPLVALAEVCTKIQDGAHRSPQILYSEPGPYRFPYLTSKNIRTGYLKLDTVQYCDANFHNEIYPRCNPELGDVLLTKDGANTGNVAINTLAEPYSLLSSVCLLKPDLTKLLSRFLFFYIQSKEGFEQITGQMTGAAIKRIILKTIKTSSIPLPSRPEQERIVAILDQVSAKTQSLGDTYERKVAALTELKKSILHKAFTGKLTADTKVADRTITEASI